MNKWIAVAVALIGCGTNAVEGPSASPLAQDSEPVVLTDTDLIPADTLASVESEDVSREEMSSEPLAGETLAFDAEAPVDPEAAVPTEPAVPVHSFELRRGESLHHFARWSEQPIEQIAAQSDLALDGDYAVGTQVRLQLAAEDLARVEARRDAHHQTRATAYLDSRGPHSTGFYTVKTGDSAWKIAQSTEAIPVWLLESMNPSVDLERLRPGEELLVPVFVDVTASLDEEE